MFAHTQVRDPRESAAACQRHALGTPSPWPPFGSIKNIPLNCLALSSFGFSIAHLCFAFFYAASDMCFYISGNTLSGFEVVCFLASLLPEHVYPSRGLSFNKMNLLKPVHASDNFLSPSTFQKSSIFSPSLHQVMYECFW